MDSPLIKAVDHLRKGDKGRRNLEGRGAVALRGKSNEILMWAEGPLELCRVIRGKIV